MLDFFGFDLLPQSSDYTISTTGVDVAGRRTNRRSSAGSAQRTASPGAATWEDSSMLYETTRLRNELRSKDRELEEAMVEVRTLKSAMLTKDRALEKADGQLAAAKDRLLGLEGDVLSLKKSLAKTEAERDAYRQEVDTALREADRLNEVVAQIPRESGSSLDIARLENQLAELRQENQQLADDNKACYNVIRAKEKELARQGKKVAAAEEAVLSKRELENVIADLRRQLSEMHADLSTLQKMQRLKDAEVADAERDAAKTVKELATTSEYLAAVTAELQLTKAALNEAKVEVSCLRDELARVSAVASRVARAELRGGGKDEGTIPVLMHLEEVKYMQGEIHRLKQKLEHAERSAVSAQQQKERLYKRIDALAANAEGLSSRMSAMGAEQPHGSTHNAGAGGEPDGDEDLLLDSPAALIRELRAQAADLHDQVAMKGEEAALLAQQLEDRAAKLDATRAEMVKLKGRLCEVMGDDAYMAEFGEPPPPPGDDENGEAVGESDGAGRAQVAGEAAQAQDVAAELQRALQDLAQHEEAAAALQQQLEQAQQQAQQELQQKDEELQQAREEAQQAQQQLEQLQQAQQEQQAAPGEEAQQAVREAEAARAELERRLHLAEATADAAAGEADSLQEQLAEAEGRVAQLEAEMAQLREHRQGLGVGALAATSAAGAAGAASAATAAYANGAEGAAGVAGSAEPAGHEGDVLQAASPVTPRELPGLEALGQGEDSDSDGDHLELLNGEAEDLADDANGSSPATQAGLALASAKAAARARRAAGASSAPPGMSPEALAALVERLLERREAEKREGAERDDGALFDEMTAGLKAEMARLGKEMVDREAAADRLRSEMGSLEAAKLSAEAVAARLDEMNEMSMRVAALKNELVKQEAEHEERETALLTEIVQLRAKVAQKKKSPTKMLKKTLTQAAKGFKESLGSPSSSHGPEEGVGGGPKGKLPLQLPFTLSKRRDSARASTVEENVLSS
ncbi:hypothetical protein N2152v2_008248 [Parachlorella kessleri]